MNPPVIYHHTGLVTFRSILESRVIRATHYRDFEDKNELRLGINALLEAVKRYPVNDTDQEYRDFLIAGIEAFGEGELQVFVASFTGQHDSKYHWDNYPYGDVPKVAIGFCHERVLKGFGPKVPVCENGQIIRNDPANRYLRCRYEPDIQKLVAERFFSQDGFPAGFKHPPSWQSFGFPALSVSIYQTICSIKGDSFKPESEIRCFNVNPKEERYPSQMMDNGRRYIEMSFDPAEFVKEVWVGGPKDPRHKCVTVIDEFRERGLINCTVIDSTLFPG